MADAVLFSHTEDIQETLSFTAVNTAITRVNEFIVWRTLALVDSLLVDTRSVLAHVWIVTLVNVGAITSRRIKVVASVTDTTKHSKDVLTLAIHTEVVEHLTLVYINTVQFIGGVWVHEAHLTVTLEGPWVVQAMAILTQGWVLRALIYVLTEGAVAPEPDITHTLEGAVSVDALSVAVTATVVGETLVDIPTSFPISCEPVSTMTLIGAINVAALSIRVTAERSHGTLIIVSASWTKLRFDTVAVFAAAGK